MKNRLLITGASGFLGWNICKQAASAWKVFGICNTHPVDIGSITSIKLDITKYAELKKLFSEIQPGAVIHTAAVSDPNYCQVNPSETHKINVNASADIAGLCTDFQIPCVFTSTDLIFDGLEAPYSESGRVNPVCVYGEQKAEAEKAMQSRCPEAAICRMPLMFGYTGGANKNFFYKMVQTLLEGKRVRLFSDEYRTPADTESAAKGLLLATEKIKGIIHMGGPTRISRYEMGKMIARLLKVSESQVEPTLQKDIDMPAPRPPDVSLVSSQAYSIGYNPLDIEPACSNILNKVRFQINH
ncbi:MAG: NAD(P)-dependent oxidoreductase [Desulfobacterales bacterium]|nr:NAD(P)-dependent oxidoreductase [Desulfobacterales bacterium]